MNEQRPAIPASEALLDAAVEYTFPASDPISVDHAFTAARRRENRGADSSLTSVPEVERRRRQD